MILTIRTRVPVVPAPSYRLLWRAIAQSTPCRPKAPSFAVGFRGHTRSKVVCNHRCAAADLPPLSETQAVNSNTKTLSDSRSCRCLRHSRIQEQDSKKHGFLLRKNFLCLPNSFYFLCLPISTQSNPHCRLYFCLICTHPNPTRQFITFLSQHNYI